MHVLVCVKQVPDTTEVKMDPKTNTLDRSSAPAIINPYDEHAVEEAVRIKKEFGGRVSIISMGPPQAQDVIRKCIEMGADEGYLLSDRAFAGSDTLATSYIITMGIKKIMEKESVDLVFCGKQAIDGDTAQVGPGIACRLNMPQLTYVEKIESLDLGKKQIVVHRKIDNGYEVVQAKLPCLVTIEKSINDISYSPLPNMIKAARYKAVIWGIKDFEADLSQLGLKGSPTSVRRVFPPPQRNGGEMLKGSIQQVTGILVNSLKGGIIKWQS
ncbi:MAG: electron transfer flavoprotein subunit beta/FixA family protein [Ruminiclostridium sp.]|nr:electron transfer flavoprotein subunit beta/FixA family protein [Ruminiclostridium sp.]